MPRNPEYNENLRRLTPAEKVELESRKLDEQANRFKELTNEDVTHTLRETFEGLGIDPHDFDKRLHVISEVNTILSGLISDHESTDAGSSGIDPE